MKKIIALFLALTLALSFVVCGVNNDSPASKQSTEVSFKKNASIS